MKDKLPCKQCPILARCFHMEKIYCTILYDYVSIYSKDYGFDRYKPIYTAEEVYDLYGKYIIDTFYSEARVSLSKTIGVVNEHKLTHEQKLKNYRIREDHEGVLITTIKYF